MGAAPSVGKRPPETWSSAELCAACEADPALAPFAPAVRARSLDGAALVRLDEHELAELARSPGDDEDAEEAAAAAARAIAERLAAARRRVMSHSVTVRGMARAPRFGDAGAVLDDLTDDDDDVAAAAKKKKPTEVAAAAALPLAFPPPKPHADHPESGHERERRPSGASIENFGVAADGAVQVRSGFVPSHAPVGRHDHTVGSRHKRRCALHGACRSLSLASRSARTSRAAPTRTARS